MRRATSILFLLSLAFGYALGLIFAIGLSARIDWPWQPLAGRSGLAVHLLYGLPHALAVISVAAVVGLALLLRYRHAAPKLALVVALPAALNLLLSIVQLAEMQMPSLQNAMLMLKDLLLITVAPMAITVLMMRITGQWMTLRV